MKLHISAYLEFMIFLTAVAGKDHDMQFLRELCQPVKTSQPQILAEV